MEETEKTERQTSKVRTVLCVTLLVLISLAALSFAALKIYLASPYPAAQLSRFLTSYLHQPVRVSGVDASGTTLYLKGVRLANPSGFPAGDLLSLDSAAVAPDLGDLWRGKRTLDLVDLRGVTVALVKNGQGQWNFSALERHFAAQKPAKPAPETSIRHLAISDAAFSVEGKTVRGIDLDLRNLSTKGRSDSSFTIDCEDPWHSRYLISGRARPGTEPAFDLALRADPFFLEGARALVKSKAAAVLSAGKGKLELKAALEKGVLRVDGALDFHDLALAAGGTSLSLAGTARLSGVYDRKTDDAVLQSFLLDLHQLATVRGSGTVREVRGARAFKAALSMSEVELGRLAFLLPRDQRQRTELGGKLSCRTLRLTGTAAGGVRDASGALLLKDSHLKRDGRTLFSGLDATVEVADSKGGILLNGHASERADGTEVLLQGIDAPFSASLSPKMKPVSGEILLRSARVGGVDLSGRVGFAAAAREPYSVALQVPAGKVTLLNPLLKKYGVQLASGSAAVSLSGTGRGPGDFSATVTTRIGQLQGTRGDQPLALQSAALDSTVTRKGGEIAAAGKLTATGATYAGKRGDAAFSYRLANNLVTLRDGSVRSAGDSATFAILSARLRGKERPAAGYPLSVAVSGATIRHGDAEARGVSGTLRGRYFSDPKAKGTEGSLALTTQSVSWQGKLAGAPALRLAFSRTGGDGEIGGVLLGAPLKGQFSYRPAVPEQERFKVALSSAQLKALSAFLPAKNLPSFSKGVADLRAEGTYSRSAGFRTSFAVHGSGIEVTDKGGKVLVTGGGVVVDGALAGQKLTVAEAVVSAGPALALRVKGEAEQAFSPQRKGSFTFSVPATSLNDVKAPFLGRLPDLVQETAAAGSVAVQGRLDLHEGKQLLEGTVTLQDGRMELASQKFVVADINGKIPVSLDLSGADVGATTPGLSVSRENYPKLLQALQQPAKGGATLTVGKVSYGSLDLGTLSVQLAAQNGVTEIKSLRFSVYDGTVYGKGSISMKKGGNFRIDLLANGVSLKKLCSAVPNIQGYISGRIDGFLSLSGVGGGLQGLTGYTDLWARAGSGEKMVVSKEFLQRLSNRKLAGFFFSSDRRYDRAEIRALLQKGDLSFEALDIEHTNLFGVRDLSVSIVPTQNMIALDHLLASIKQAATRGKAATGRAPAGTTPAAQPAPAPTTEFKWEE